MEVRALGEHPTPPKGPRNSTSRDAGFWALGRNVLRVADVPGGAVNLNVEGRRVIGALQGFGQLWHNAGLRSVLYAMVAQARIVSGLLRRRS
jgi:hypothetical protein